MSTVNPRDRQQNTINQQAARGRGPAIIGSIVWGIALIGTGAIVARGLISVADVFRIMNLNSVFAWDETPDAPMPWLLVGGIFAGLIAAHWYQQSATRAASGTTPAVRPFSLQALGFTGTSVWAACGDAGWWRAPSAIGVAVDPSFGNDEPWGPVEWVFYALPTVLAVAAAVLTVLTLALRLLRRRLEARRTSYLTTALSRTSPRPGTVSDVTATGLVVNDVPMIQVVTEFVDQSGQRRWVTKSALIPRTLTPTIGDEAEVVYLPEHVADEKRIIVLIGWAIQARRAAAGEHVPGARSLSPLRSDSPGVLS
ncbi:MAG: hypothetical protein ACTJHU_03930 [Mycetocola sp.]